VTLSAPQGVRVTARENTGAGFYTTLDVSHRSPIKGVTSPLGDVGSTVVGLEHGMGFLSGFRMVTFIGWKATHMKRARLASILSE
jgi:hypothetical protein